MEEKVTLKKYQPNPDKGATQGVLSLSSHIQAALSVFASALNPLTRKLRSIDEEMSEMDAIASIMRQLDLADPTNLPTAVPTEVMCRMRPDPTLPPTAAPTEVMCRMRPDPTLAPTAAPTEVMCRMRPDPTLAPTAAPTEVMCRMRPDPTLAPTTAPTEAICRSCYKFTYNSFVTNGALTTLSFSLQVNCNHALSYFAVELPAGLSPGLVMNIDNTNPLFSYSNEVGTNNPFYSVKWEATNAESFKNGALDTFLVSIPTTAFNIYVNIRVEAKASTLVERVAFSRAGSCSVAPSVTTTVSPTVSPSVSITPAPTAAPSTPSNSAAPTVAATLTPTAGTTSGNTAANTPGNTFNNVNNNGTSSNGGSTSVSALFNTSNTTVTAYVTVLILFIAVTLFYAMVVLGGGKYAYALFCNKFTNPVIAAKRGNASALGNLRPLSVSNSSTGATLDSGSLAASVSSEGSVFNNF
eukprot:gene13872-15949_t